MIPGLSGGEMEDTRYTWYPKLKNGELDLNPWWALAYRRVNQWFRRTLYWKLRPRRYQELIWEQSLLAHPEEISQQERKRLGELLWILGDDTPYRYTKEQSKRIGQDMLEVVEEVLATDRACREKREEG
jgi:hypothetical protein